MIARKTDVTEAQYAAAEQYDLRHCSNVQGESENSTYEQSFPSFDLAALTGLAAGDLEFAQPSTSELFNPLFEELSWSLEQLDARN